MSGHTDSRRSTVACDSCSASSATAWSSAASRAFSLAATIARSVSGPITPWVTPIENAAASPFGFAVVCSKARDVRSWVAVSTRILLVRLVTLFLYAWSPDRPVDELAIDVDEDDRLGVWSALHPDRRRHGARLEIEPLPYAARRRTIPSTAGDGELVFREAFVRERLDDVSRLCRPRVLVFGPMHLAALPELVQPLEHFHAHLLSARLSYPSGSSGGIALLCRVDDHFVNFRLFRGSDGT